MNSEILNLPTILDVMEELAKEEVNESLGRIGINFLKTEPNTYTMITKETGKNIPILFPNSANPFLFFRGQNQFYENCVPTIYRVPNGMTDDDFFIISRIKTMEFIRIIKNHPVLKDFNNNFYVDFLALAQHYAFPTEYLDVTNDKWVAAFFACTRVENGQYYPVDCDFRDGVGVLYISLPKEQQIGLNNDIFDKLTTIGFQYFKHPSNQSSFYYKLNKDESFNDSKYFRMIRFRHDITASNVIFNMAYNKHRFIPDDHLTEIANKVLDKSYQFSIQSIVEAKEYFNINESLEEIQIILRKHNILWHNSPKTNIEYDLFIMNKDWDEWNKYGRTDLMRKINPILPIISL